MGNGAAEKVPRSGKKCPACRKYGYYHHLAPPSHGIHGSSPERNGGSIPRFHTEPSPIRRDSIFHRQLFLGWWVDPVHFSGKHLWSLFHFSVVTFRGESIADLAGSTGGLRPACTGLSQEKGKREFLIHGDDRTFNSRVDGAHFGRGRDDPDASREVPVGSGVNPVGLDRCFHRCGRQPGAIWFQDRISNP